MVYSPDFKYFLIGIALIVVFYCSIRDKLSLFNKEEPVIKRDVNLELLIIIIFSLVFFTILSIYFTSTFNGLLTQYNNTLNQQTNMSKELDIYKQELNETSRINNRIEESKKAIESQYVTISTECNNLHLKQNCDYRTFN